MVKRKKSVVDRVMSVFQLASRKPGAKEAAMEVVKKEYPRIHKMIEVCWGSEELQQKLTNLLQMDDPNREGFPMHVTEALMIIQEIHMDEFEFDPFANSFMNSTQTDKW
jgi:hypothetical protein